MSNPIGVNNNPQYSDIRFIPSREAMKKSCSFISPPQSLYQKKLVQALVPNYSEKTLHFTTPKEYVPKSSASSSPKWEYPAGPKKAFGFQNFYDEYYTNNLDWGKQCLGVNAGNVCYIWNKATHELDSFFSDDEPSDLVQLHSLKSSPGGDVIAIGDSTSTVCVFDPAAKKTIHSEILVDTDTPLPVYSLSWKTEFEFTAACDGELFHLDRRSKSVAWSFHATDHIICSLERSPDGSLLVRGGADGIVEAFDVRRACEGVQRVFSYSHSSAVKALKWMPNSTLLFSGGGFTDQMLKVFDTSAGKQVCQAKTWSQICSIEPISSDEVILGMGHTENHYENSDPKWGIQFWKFDSEGPRLKKMHETFFTDERTFNVSKNPHSLEFSSISTDGKMRIWEVKPFSNKNHHEREIFSSNPNLNGFTIR